MSPFYKQDQDKEIKKLTYSSRIYNAFPVIFICSTLPIVNLYLYNYLFKIFIYF